MNSRLKVSVQMHSPIMILFLTFLLIGSCTSTNVIQKSRTVSRESESFTHDLREIEEYASQITSSVVIAGKTISPELQSFPNTTVSSKGVEIQSVIVKSINASTTVLVSKQQPNVSVSVPTNQLRRVSTFGRRVTHPSWLWWLFLLLPLALLIGVVTTATEWGENTERGCANGFLLAAGFAGSIGTFILLAWNVGLFWRREILEFIDITWWFAQ